MNNKVVSIDMLYYISMVVQNCNIIEEINGSVTVELNSNENSLGLLINTQEPAAIFKDNVNEDSADKSQAKTYLNLSTFYPRENGDEEINSSVGDDSKDKDYIVPDTYIANNIFSDNEAENYHEKVAEMVEETELSEKILTKKDLEIQKIGTEICSFGALVSKPIQLFMFCAVYGPSALVLLVCYGYVYIVARGHARAIRSETRHSRQATQRTAPLNGGGGTTGPPRYGLALAITAGMFLGLWLPFQVCMLLDVFFGTNILTAWISVYLALPILASSAFNPWVYGYRNSELRCAVRRVVDDLLSALGFTHRSHHRNSDPIVHSAVATAGDVGSFINHVQRDCFDWKPGKKCMLYNN
ncbi:unnamed protein product [Diabrotica balteata]|uniref:G-protein coupled receptors family 1 profile domain-containing protein n=1 Tax=Diabrotica balteata TaxID=107213 RepID=A0A9N9TCN8_DIABA|nr:unnamed protein product [Diabrotica balteata]